MLEIIQEMYAFMETVMKKAIDQDTGQHYLIEMPASESVRQAILELEYPDDGISIRDASVALAERFQLSEEQRSARNSSNINLFRHNVVTPQFKRLLEEDELEQPGGPKTRYFLAGSREGSSDTKLCETEEALAVETVERTAVNPDTREEYQITLPSTPVVKRALLSFDYPASGIEIKDVAEALADQFALTDEQKNARGYYGLVWRRHVTIAANTFVNSAELLRLRRGWITNPEQPDIEISEPDVEVSGADGTSVFSDGDTPSPEVIIAQNYREHQNRLKEDLLQKIKDNPPDFFEELVLDLLVKMGYGGSRADAEAVGRSGDGGIDGVIKADPLGLNVIYIQAKRWEGNVGEPPVRDFVGALDIRGATGGFFITTSDFNPMATSVAEGSSKQVILINGNQLAQLMIDHNVGVSLGNFYQLKEVDLDYFAIDDTVDAD